VVDDTKKKTSTKRDTIDPVLKARGERLNILRGMLCLNSTEFAKFVDRGASTVRQWQDGRSSGLARRSAECIVEALENTPVKCSVEWLLHGTGDLPSFSKSPVEPSSTLSETKANERHESASGADKVSTIAQESSIGVDSLKEEMNLYRQRHQNVIILKLSDDAMAPAYYPGDFVGGSYVVDDEIKQLLNNICIVQTIEGQVLLRKLTATDKPGCYRLSCLNPITELPVVLETELSYAALVKRVWRP